MASSPADGSTKVPPRVSLREQQKLFTRQRLIDGALEVFGEQGYAASTIDDIAEAAGASRATFYLHFPSKLALTQALGAEMRPEVTAYYDALDEVLLKPTRDGLADWMDNAVGWFSSHRTFARLLAEVRVVEPDEELKELLAIGYIPDRMTKYLAKIPKRRRELARLRVALLVDQLATACLMFLSGEFDVTREEFVDELTDVWCATLGIPA